MVELSRHGWALRKIAARFGVSKDTVKKWIVRADGKRLDRADFSDQRARKKIDSQSDPPNGGTVYHQYPAGTQKSQRIR